MKEVTNKDAVTLIRRWLGTGSINIFGLPFSGKDTHGKELAKLLNGELVGGGEILRGEHVPQHVKDHIATGALTPTEEYLNIVLPHLSLERYAGKPVILSSVGRWHGEEPSVMKASNDSGHPIKAVIYLNIDRPEVIRRQALSLEKGDRSHRHKEDAELTLQKRFEEFENKTLPVIYYYRQAGLLIEIDGKPPVTSVNNEIVRRLIAKASV